MSKQFIKIPYPISSSAIPNQRWVELSSDEGYSSSDEEIGDRSSDAMSEVSMDFDFSDSEDDTNDTPPNTPRSRSSA